MTTLAHLCAPIDLNDAEPQIPRDETKSKLGFNDFEPVDDVTVRTIAREVLRAGEGERSV